MLRRNQPADFQERFSLRSGLSSSSCDLLYISVHQEQDDAGKKETPEEEDTFPA